MIRKRSNKFKFKPFSEKQLKILNWWQEGSPTSDRFFVVADGSIRAGKTISMALSFLLFVMRNFNQLDAAMAGKTIGALRRNLVNPLKQIGETLGYEITDHRSDNYLEVSKGNITNNIWLFGAKDEASQDLVDCAVCG